jgi:hypothetical protein
MKKVLVIILLLAGPFSDYTSAKWYSRTLQLKLDSLKIADSLRVIDSIRFVDSMHIADSCMMARYRESDKIRVTEKIRRADSLKAAEMYKNTSVTEDINAPILPGESDNITARTIVIDPQNPYAKEIDSLQFKIDNLNNAIYDGDSRFKNMKTFAFPEKKRYMLFLLQNKMKDTTAILTCCNQLLDLYMLKYELLLTIRKSQDANTKSFIQFHIEEHQKKMGEVSNFLRSLTPDVPFSPERNLPGNLSGQ